MGKQGAPHVVTVGWDNSKDRTPNDQLPMASRIVRRLRSGKVVTRMASIHQVRVWTRVPHPRYGNRVPHFVPSYLPCRSDHAVTRECST